MRKFRAIFKLEISWQDPRLTFYHLKEDKSRNQLLTQEYNSIWTPHIFIDDINTFFSEINEPEVIQIERANAVGKFKKKVNKKIFLKLFSLSS